MDTFLNVLIVAGAGACVVSLTVVALVVGATAWQHVRAWLDDRDRVRRLARLSAQTRERVGVARVKGCDESECERIWSLPSREPRRMA